MRDAQVRRAPVVSDVGHLVGAISIDDLVLVAQTSEQAPTQGSLSGSMPLVASNGGDEAFGSPSRFGDGVDHLFVAALVASGVRRAGDNATRRLIDARSSVVEPLQSAGGGRPVGGRSRSTAGRWS